jgi:uncharacterized membrane protein (UPF0182 family)
VAVRPPSGLPKLSRRSRILLIVGVAVLVGLIVGSRLLDAYVAWLWFGEVGYRSVFTTVLVTRLLLFLAVGVLVGGLLAVSLFVAYRTRPVFVPVAGPDDPVSRYRSAVVARLRLFGIGLPVIVGLISGAAAQNNWQQVQLFLHGTRFGVNDPQFGNDVGFYAFQLPFYSWVLGWLFVAVALSFFGALVAHYLFGGIRLAGRGGQLSAPARTQLAVTAGLFVLLKAVAYFFDRYTLLLSQHDSFTGASYSFTGASYTDLNAVLPAKLILLCIAVFCAVAFFSGAFLRNLQLPAIAAVLLMLSSLLVGAAWPAILQQFSVAPNANEKESLPIQRNIDATTKAFGLTPDKVKYEPYSGRTNLSSAEVKADQATIPNIRLLDPNVVSGAFTQRAQRKNFYGFPPKLNIDRYNVNGQTNDYVVAAREINTEGLADNQRSWINRHLIYTHGNGFVAAKANLINQTTDTAGGAGGYPVFTVSELGTDGNLIQGDIPVQQPRIYYGLLAGDYAIVGGNPGQAPGEYDTDTKQFTYDGPGGVPIGDWFKRMVFAAHYGERNILFNQAIGDNSRIMFNRDPRDRVKQVAPWLTTDGDPYPAVVDGHIQWIVDGLTTLNSYPYSQLTSLGGATSDSLPANGVRKQPNTQINYIRNSVKATVDAYTGEVKLYSVDDNDPVLKAWQGVFPGTVRPSSEISPSLRQHFRYPEDLFKVQRELLARYHVTNPQEFYSNVSFWDVPTDPTADSPTTQQQIQSQTQQQPPYYVLSGDPDHGKPSFQLTSPLVSQKRDFMSAYVSAGSDPENYGKLTVLQLPTDSQTPGPKQMQTQFITSNQVSIQLNQLRQQQTKVVYGNLLTLPVGGGLLYVEPVFVEQNNASSTSYPQLSRVLASFGGTVGFAPDLKGALDQVFGAGETANPPQNGSTPPGSASPPTSAGNPSSPTQVSPDMAKAIDDIQSALQRIRTAQQSGDWVGLGQAYKDLDDASKRFEQARTASSGPQSSAAPTPTPSR